MESVALHDFTASATDELSFKAGSVVKIMKMDDKSWYKAEQDGRVGFIPSNYIQMRNYDFYHGKVARVQAEQVLLGSGMDGAFLIRDSESSPDDFSLSIKFGDGIQHFKILRDESGKYFIWDVKFNSLNELIEYHKKAPVSRTPGATNMVLRVAISPGGGFTAPPAARGGFGAAPKNMVRALFDFTPQEAGELGFRKGDMIEVVDDSDPNWWQGTCSGQTGLFPSSYCQRV